MIGGVSGRVRSEGKGDGREAWEKLVWEGIKSRKKGRKEINPKSEIIDMGIGDTPER